MAGDPSPSRSRSRSSPRRPAGAARQGWSEEFPSSDDGDPEAAGEFRHHIVDMYMRNKHSAKDTQVLAKKATAAGAQGINDFSNVGCEAKWPGNFQRDLMRKMLRGCEAPPVYWAQVTGADPSKGEKKTNIWLPFLLIHELMSLLLGDERHVTSLAQLPANVPGLKQMKDQWCRQHRTPPEATIGIGLHGDGVPIQRSGKTIEVFSWNFLAVPQAERYPFALVEQQFMCQCGCKGRCTIDSIFGILLWCMICLLAGRMPTKRHDGTEWLPSDKSRRKGCKLGFMAALLQVRGDWAFLKQIFGFKGWSSASICWKCMANVSDLPWVDFTSNAKWRGTRLTLKDMLARLLQEKVRLSPLFSLPGFDISMIVIDVLHTMDLGCSQDAMGNIFWEAVHEPGYLAGRNQEARKDTLWAMIKDFYKRTAPRSNIQKLTMEMIKQDAKPPKFKGKGGETRYLVPFAVELTQFMHAAKPSQFTKAMAALTNSLLAVYTTFSTEPFDQGALVATSRQFCLQYSALGHVTKSENLWKPKPKFHLMQELCEYTSAEAGNPREFWCYKDEDFVGFASVLASSRGGGKAPHTNPLKTLDRWRALCAA